jgi:hypothetical protein
MTDSPLAMPDQRVPSRRTASAITACSRGPIEPEIHRVDP